MAVVVVVGCGGYGGVVDAGVVMKVEATVEMCVGGVVRWCGGGDGGGPGGRLFCGGNAVAWRVCAQKLAG